MTTALCDQFTATDLPQGFNTVAGFIAETWPHELELLADLTDDPIEAYRDTEAKLREDSATLSMAVHEVRCGGKMVPAFDVRLLQVRLPEL